MVLVKIIGVLLIIAIIALAALYYFNPFGVKNTLGLINPIKSTVPVSQIINSSLGNNANANYSYMNKLSLKTSNKYNESVSYIILFTGNSSNVAQEKLFEELFLSQQGSPYYIKYNGLYVPIAQNISGIATNKTNATKSINYIPSLIGERVYIYFVAVYNNNLTIQVPYIVQSEKITNGSIGKFVYWHLTQDTGISNSTAINVNNESLAQSNITVNFPIEIYYKGIKILFPSGK